MAAQTAKVVYDVYLSPEHEEDDVDAAPFVLKAWVSNLQGDLKVDGKDPWAAGIDYPPPSPTQVVRDRLRLSSPDEGRSWVVNGGCDPLFTAQAWAKPKSRHDEYSPPHGNRLQINRRRLAPVLKKLGLDMILQVQVNRKARQSSYGRSAEGDMIEYPNAYFMTYLFRQGGTVETFF
jgi:hypothetical protein